jgi:hypothetical protein
VKKPPLVLLHCYRYPFWQQSLGPSVWLLLVVDFDAASYYAYWAIRRDPSVYCLLAVVGFDSVQYVWWETRTIYAPVLEA